MSEANNPNHSQMPIGKVELPKVDWSDVIEVSGRKEPHRCQVCNGSGICLIPIGDVKADVVIFVPGPCHSCGGTGVLWDVGT